ncbi:uncharacterized protein FRV6_16629 [Fusarium oxysporum]|uniref:Apple domain-containing protein n=1 Tax=Fusarium oxysporum TaxID=5507 RepID=A0A2H3U3G2_FUSOX|nr:uncharacterized protein FRV6_16629 [Fusarium oxysporum]
MKITFVALLLSILGTRADVVANKNDGTSLPSKRAPAPPAVPPGVSNRPEPNPNAPGPCVNGICHPGQRCVINRGQPNGLCVRDPHAPSCFAIGQRCIDVTDCCSGANVCAPPPDSPGGQSVCRYEPDHHDPCLSGSSVISRNFDYYVPHFSGRDFRVGPYDDLECCQICYGTESCALWSIRGGICFIDLYMNTETGMPLQCPAAGLEIVVPGEAGPVGRGPCIDPESISIEQLP